MPIPILAAVAARVVGSMGARAVAGQAAKSVIANTAKSEATGLTMGRSVGQLRQGMDTARQVANTARSISSTAQSVRAALTPQEPYKQVDHKPNPALEASNRQTFF
jgi:hypothetical protein